MKRHLSGVQLMLLAALISTSYTISALEFESDDGDVSGSLDTSVSFGAMWRLQGQDLGKYQGDTEPTHDDVNTNDGNRSFEKGLVSQVYKINSELELNYQDTYGLFIRGTAFYDSVLMDKTSHWGAVNQASNIPDQTGTYPYGNGWADAVKNGQGRDAEIKDAYVFAEYNLGEMPVDLRFGKHVINWGEGLFYRDGINASNALDAANFVLPGAEVKDLLIPQNAITMNIGLTDNLSMSTYYQLAWEASQVPGRGTYFSNTDLFVDGSTYGYNQIPAGLAGLDASFPGDLYAITGIKTNGDYLVVADTSGKKDADDDGQWGINFKYLVENLHDTEFGFYFINYNSHTQYIEAQINDGAASRAMIAATGVGTPYEAGLNTFYDTASNGDSAAKTQIIEGVAGAYILSNEVVAYQVFPESIQMYGMSFNTVVGNTSIAGELAFRPEMPIWIDHPDNLIEGINKNMSGILQGADCFSDLSQAEQNKEYCLSSGAYKNYKKTKLWTGSLVFLHNFGPRSIFDAVYGILSPGFEYVSGMDNYDRYVSTASGPYNDPGEYPNGDAPFKENYRPASDRLDQFSWGYTAVLSADMLDVFAGVNLNPVLSFKHDAGGNSRLTGSFLEGRKAITLALNALYMHNFETGLAYTSFFGSERTNAMADRDNIAFSVKYSF